jgi:hypothetical protein
MLPLLLCKQSFTEENIHTDNTEVPERVHIQNIFGMLFPLPPVMDKSINVNKRNYCNIRLCLVIFIRDIIIILILKLAIYTL